MNQTIILRSSNTTESRYALKGSCEVSRFFLLMAPTPQMCRSRRIAARHFPELAPWRENQRGSSFLRTTHVMHAVLLRTITVLVAVARLENPDEQNDDYDDQKQATANIHSFFTSSLHSSRRNHSTRTESGQLGTQLVGMELSIVREGQPYIAAR